MHDLFEAQARASPAETAVRFRDETLTYSELDGAANRVAQDLIAVGVCSDSVVAIDVDRSLELVIGLLGILKAGAAYLPLGADLPPERSRFIVASARPRALIASPANNRARLLRELSLIEVKLGQTGAVPRSRGTRATLAYLLYTSGSTGQPKGVAYPHAGAVSRLAWLQQEYPLRKGERVLQKTPLGFDVSFWEFFWPLAVGAVVVMAEPGGHRDPHYLVDLVEREGVNLVHFVPSMLQFFLDVEGLENRCKSLRRVFASGEALTPRLEARFFTRLQAELHNQYGPTETGECSSWACRSKQPRSFTPIGHAIPGFRFAVLDKNLEPVPPGTAGELFIAGVGLARGYFGEPGLTAERFLPDPLGPPGTRMYRTGDMVRESPAVGLEFLGRLDHQIKIAGQRIELGEIEAVLAVTAGVRDVVVVARESPVHGTELVAYVVADPGVVEADLRCRAEERLPTAMIPRAYVFLSQFPVTPNGKLDRAQLPAPAPSGQPMLSAASELELALSEVWAEVTGCLPGSVDEDFFATGGDSLRALRLLGQLRARTSIELTLKDFGALPTIRGLATMINSRFSQLQVRDE
ncbi:amino acid adenylation domain-containing protein [Bradyrhizobium sp.]